MATVFDVAKYILKKLGPMDPTKLQKLCYYCQAWALAWDEEPLFSEEFEAWPFGPVCPELYEKHEGMHWLESDFLSELPTHDFKPNEFETMDIVLRDYGDKEGWWLSSKTHEEYPWIKARIGVPEYEPSHNIVTKESMQEYYGRLAEEAQDMDGYLTTAEVVGRRRLTPEQQKRRDERIRKLIEDFVASHPEILGKANTKSKNGGASMTNSDYLTVAEAAKRLGLPQERVRWACREGRVKGAIKTGGRWLIPEKLIPTLHFPPTRKQWRLIREHLRECVAQFTEEEVFKRLVAKG